MVGVKGPIVGVGEFWMGHETSKIVANWGTQFCHIKAFLRPKHKLLFNPELQSFAGSEILTAVDMKCAIFWDITHCSPLKFNRRFGGTYIIHFHSRH
jgi:hypothetical protein